MVRYFSPKETCHFAKLDCSDREKLLKNEQAIFLQRLIVVSNELERNRFISSSHKPDAAILTAISALLDLYGSIQYGKISKSSVAVLSVRHFDRGEKAIEPSASP